jgi:hypothetical protein
MASLTRRPGKRQRPPRTHRGVGRESRGRLVDRRDPLEQGMVRLSPGAHSVCIAPAGSASWSARRGQPSAPRRLGLPSRTSMKSIASSAICAIVLGVVPLDAATPRLSKVITRRPRASASMSAGSQLSRLPRKCCSGSQTRVPLSVGVMVDSAWLCSMIQDAASVVQAAASPLPCANPRLWGPWAKT